MKKSLALLLAVLLVFSLSACTLEIKTGGAGGPTPTSTPATTSVDVSSVLTSDATATSEVTQGTSTGAATQLTRDQALAIALQRAGLQKADVRDIDAELDWERGAPVWEIHFESGRVEYEYEIHARTGEVTHREKELD